MRLTGRNHLQLAHRRALIVALLSLSGAASPNTMAAQTASPKSLLPSPSAERCTPLATSTRTPAQWLDLATKRVLPSAMSGKILRYSASQDVPYWEQSDRSYEPFVPNIQSMMRWYDPSTGVEARGPQSVKLTSQQYPSMLYGPTSTFAARDTLIRPNPAMHPFSSTFRLLNPWIVLADWQAHASEARVTQRCVFREYARVVLARGTERLYLGESDGMPIKLERTEPHYLWGQVKAEYMWNTWWGVTGAGGGLYPLASFRIIDGATYERVGVDMSSAQVIPADSGPKLTIPQVAAMSDRISIPSPSTDTVRVSANTFLLVTPAYTETVTLARDTVYLLDATSGEERARQDSTWIAKLFPGKHPVVLIVTDLAWPHISSVRFWVARGATIVTHRVSDDFIRRVVSRKWTSEPDALEKARATATLRLKLVDDSLRLAGGAITVHAMQGSTTEGALAVWLAPEKFVWAGDYVQRTPTSPYYWDVVKTVRALQLKPEKAGAQHTPLMNWADLEKRVPPQ